MTDWAYAVLREPRLSPARRLAHAERTRLNLERFEREKRDGMPQDDADGSVTFRVNAYLHFDPPMALAIRDFMEEAMNEIYKQWDL